MTPITPSRLRSDDLAGSRYENSPASTRRRARTPAVPLRLGWHLDRKPPSVMRRGFNSQPHSTQARRKKRDAFSLDNGGDSGSGYWAPLRAVLPLRGCCSPCGSEGHSATMCVRGSHRPPFSVPPDRRLLFLFAAFDTIDCECSIQRRTSLVNRLIGVVGVVRT